jgi:hypothetical protein
MKLLLLFSAICLATWLAWTPQSRSESGDASAEQLFRRKCLRCHDMKMALRPVRPEAADSLVHAMRKYDPKWITPSDVPLLTEYVRELNTRPHPHIQSQSSQSQSLRSQP